MKKTLIILSFFCVLSVSANNEEERPAASLAEAESLETNAIYEFEKIIKEQTDRKIKAVSKALEIAGRPFAVAGTVDLLSSFVISDLSSGFYAPLIATGCALIFSGKALKEITDKPPN